MTHHPDRTTPDGVDGALDMIKVLGRLALAILLTAASVPGEVGAYTLTPGALNCGFDDCVDIYTFTCAAGGTKYVVVSACDAGATLDDRMTLTAWRKSSDAQDGEGAMDSVQTANACATVVLTRPNPGPYSGLATVSSANYFAPIDYNLLVFCLDKNGADLKSPTVTLTTNQ
jgi:hypothetical protein